MNVLIVLIPLALLMGGGALFLFLLAAKNGQFDDLETPAYRALLEEKEDERSKS